LTRLFHHGRTPDYPSYVPLPTRRSSDLRQQVAIVGGIRADEEPNQQHGAHEAVYPAGLPPVLLHQAAGAGAAIQLVDLVQRPQRSEEHTSELQSRFDLVCRLLLEKKYEE